MASTLDLRVPSLERFRRLWEQRLSDGWTFVPHVDRVQHAPGTAVLLRIHVAETPAPLELEGEVRSLHVVQSDGYHMIGAEIAVDLPPYVRVAVEAFLAGDWRRATPILGDAETASRAWVSFGPSTRPNPQKSTSTSPDPDAATVGLDLEAHSKTPVDWMFAFAAEEHTQPNLPCSEELGRPLCSIPPITPGEFHYEATARYSQARALAHQSQDSAPGLTARELAEQLMPHTRPRVPPSTGSAVKARAKRPEEPAREDRPPLAFIFRKR